MTKLFLFLFAVFTVYASEIPTDLQGQLVLYDQNTKEKTPFEKNDALMPWHSHHRAIIGEFLTKRRNKDALYAFQSFNTAIDGYVIRKGGIRMDQLMLAVYGYGILVDYVNKVNPHKCEDYQHSNRVSSLLGYLKPLHFGFEDCYGTGMSFGMERKGILSIFAHHGHFEPYPYFLTELEHALEKSRVFPYIAPSTIVSYAELNQSFALGIPLCGLSLEQVGYDGIPTPSVVDGFAHDFRFHVFPSEADENRYRYCNWSQQFVAKAYGDLYGIIERSSVLDQFVLFYIGHETPFLTSERDCLDKNLSVDILAQIIQTAIKRFNYNVDLLATNKSVQRENNGFCIKRLYAQTNGITVLDVVKKLSRFRGPLTFGDVKADEPNAFATSGLSGYNSLFDLQPDILQVPIWTDGQFNAEGIKLRFTEIFTDFLSRIKSKI